MSKKLSKFEPSWWLRNHHIQSCYGFIFRKQSKTLLRWEELILPDGDFVDVAYAGNPQAPIVIMLHGLEGSIYSHYMQYMLDPMVSLGFQVVVMHYRSCSGRLNRLAKAYHAGDNGDFSYFIDILSKRHPQQQFLAIGFSLGGNVLLNYLAAHPAAPILSGMVVSVPFELLKCAKQTTFVYRWNLISSMKQKMIQKAMLGMSLPLQPREIAAIETLYDFDEALTAPMNGFSSANDYYEKVSSRYILGNIKHPVVIIHAVDDPMIPPHCLPSQHELPKNLELELSRYGGHVGFVQGYPWRPNYWLLERVMHFLQSFQIRQSNQD